MVQLAVKTLAAIDAAVAADGGNAYRVWLGKVLPHIGDAYRAEEAPFRSHMGASGIGNECARAIWYGFRWSTLPRPEGRMLRLWNRGHLEEGRFIALLLSIGCTVLQQDEYGRQFRISDHGGHYGGSGDGMFDGCPDLPPGTRALCEFKTHNDKSFKKLKEDGVRVSKFTHYVQMQQYMRKMGLAVAVYFAVNKNDDEIYAEIIYLDTEIADRYLHRAGQIIPLHVPPKRISESPSWFQCKFCDHKAVCHSGAAPVMNCRTCEYVEPLPDGTWFCHHHVVTVDKATQLQGCSFWAKNSKAFK